MLQLKNSTQFAPAISVFPNANGVDTLYVVVKVALTLFPALAVCDSPVPVTAVDEYFGDPATTSLKQASELHLGKPGCDVILMGSAWAPEGRAVTQSMVSLLVATRRVVARVIGNRRWKSNGFTEPEPFESMPLVHERAFGGRHQQPDEGLALEEARNPVGVGFCGKRSAYDMIGQPLPNIEHPSSLISKVGDHPTPLGFGFVAPSWLLRRQFAGTYDKRWQRTRAPYLPKDFDSRFFQTAPETLRFDQPLRGGEPIELVGATPGAPVRFHIPRGTPRLVVDIAGNTQEPPPQLETVLLEPDVNRVCLTYRASVRCDKQALKVREVTIEPGSLELPRGAS